MSRGDWEVNDRDHEVVSKQLGRPPRGRFRVVVRDESGVPRVIENYPLLNDGTPMPTLYWLTDVELIKRVGRIESHGGVDAAEADVDEHELAAAHARYAQSRTALLSEKDRLTTALPSGGVGGTRTGVKCLHAHFANALAGNADPVGEWVQVILCSGEFEGTTI